MARDVERTDDVASCHCPLCHQSFFVRGEEHASGLRASTRLQAMTLGRAVDGWAVLVHGLGEDLHEQNLVSVIQVRVGHLLR